MIVLNEVDFSPNNLVESLLIKAFHKKASVICEYFRLYDQDVWDFGLDDIHNEVFFSRLVEWRCALSAFDAVVWNCEAGYKWLKCAARSTGFSLKTCGNDGECGFWCAGLIIVNS